MSKGHGYDQRHALATIVCQLFAASCEQASGNPSTSEWAYSFRQLQWLMSGDMITLSESIEIRTLTTLVAISFVAIHDWSHLITKWLYTSEKIAISFGGGMAITYVFLHLLPELDQGATFVGRFPIYIVALFGFLLFYGVQRWIWCQT